MPRRSRKISRNLFHADVRTWAARVGVTPTRVQVQPLTRKWASCSTAGRLTFSADLLSQPPRFRDEVIVHELVHLIAANHGKLFKSLMRAHLGIAAADERIATCTMETYL
jgi:predicted metal-dependent hydrolase